MEAGSIMNNGNLVSTDNYRLVIVELNYEYIVLAEAEVQANIDTYNANN